MVQESTENETIHSGTPATASDSYGYSYQYGSGSYANQSQQAPETSFNNNQATEESSTEKKSDKYRLYFSVTSIVSAILFSILISFTRIRLWKQVGFQSLNSFNIFMMVVLWPIAFVNIVILLLTILKFLFGRSIDVPAVPKFVSNLISIFLTVLFPVLSLVFFIVGCNTTRTWALGGFSYFMIWAILAFQSLLLNSFFLIKANTPLIFSTVKSRSLDYTPQVADSPSLPAQ